MASNEPETTGFTQVEYMYRDFANYKQHGAVIFTGAPDPALIERLWAAVGGKFDDSRFNPDQVGLPNLRQEMPGHYDDDNDIHEITDITGVDTGPTDSRTFKQFVRECEAVDEWWNDTEQGQDDAGPHIRLGGSPLTGFFAHGPYPNKAAALTRDLLDDTNTPIWALPLWSVRQPVVAADPDARPTSECGCGYQIVYTGDGWQHDTAPWFWGGDHDPQPNAAAVAAAAAYDAAHPEGD
jgi:hypothetical protein